MTSHYPCQGFWLNADCDGLAAADADVSEDPEIDAAEHDDGQAQQQEADVGLGTDAEQHRRVGGVDGVITDFLGWINPQERWENREKLVTEKMISVEWNKEQCLTMMPKQWCQQD